MLDYEFLSPDKNRKMLKAYKYQKRNWLLVDKKWILPNTYLEYCERINHFETRSDDVWILSFPRSGTTMTQELVWLLQNNMDFQKASEVHLTQRSIFFEAGMIIDQEIELERFGRCNTELYDIDFLNKMSSSRCIKSHLPLSLLPTVARSNCKVIYIARNPKSVLTSYYEFKKNLYGFHFDGNFAEFFELIQNDLAMWCPYWENVKDAWKRRHQHNFLFLFYEEVVKDLSTSIRKVARFLNKTYSDEDVEKLAKHLDFANLQKNPSVNNIPVFDEHIQKQNHFIRSGQSDGWKSYFTKDIENRVNKWIIDNIKDTNLYFPCFDAEEPFRQYKSNLSIDN